MQDKRNLLSLERDQITISKIKWEALRRNPNYIRFAEECFDRTKGKVKPECFSTKEFHRKLRDFGIRYLRDPEYEPKNEEEKKSVENYGYRTLFFHLPDIRVFYPALSFPLDKEFLSNLPNGAIIFVVNPYSRRENIMAIIEEYIEAVRRGLGISGYTFQGRKGEKIERKRTVPQKRIKRVRKDEDEPVKKGGPIDYEYYKKCFKAWDLREKEKKSFEKIGNELFPDCGGYAEKIAKAKALYKVAKYLIDGGYKTFGETYLRQ